MPARQIVVVAGEDDRDADEITHALMRVGRQPIRLNSTDIPVHSVMSLHLDQRLHGRVRLPSAGTHIDLERVGAVWWSGEQASGIPDSLSVWEREFAIEELEQAYRGLWAALDCYWMSRPDRLRRAGWRMAQLDYAHRLGFEVPRAVVTTSPDTAFEFYASCDGQVVRKDLADHRAALAGFRVHHPDLPPRDGDLLVRTGQLGDDDLVELGRLRTTPCFLQQYLPSRLDLRVTVVGDEVVPAAFETGPDGTRQHRPVRLPTELAERCVAFVAGYGLTLSTIDMIATADDRYVFLGAQPGGRIGHLQQHAPQLRLADVVAACLVRGARG